MQRITQFWNSGCFGKGVILFSVLFLIGFCGILRGGNSVSTTNVAAVNTPAPTSIPAIAPTHTPVASAPPFEEIRSNMRAMTEAQWNRYIQTLAGTRVENWQGFVLQVNEKAFGGYEVWIDMDNPDVTLSVQEVTFDVSEDIALRLNKEQAVTFSGTIAVVLNTLGTTSIRLDNAAIE